jgi:hypothetical protein
MLDDAKIKMTGLLPVEPGYKQVLRVRALIFWLPLLIAAAIADLVFLLPTPFYGLPSIGMAFLAATAILVVPSRRYQRLGYALHPTLLQVVRGWLFHADTMVPLVRVQHIDVTRGPIDKMFGTASLVVHTAGTHNSVVVLPGLAPDRASEIRDEIRRHIRSDFE